MNNYLGLMLCLKDVEGAPTALEKADVPLKGIKLCTLVLGTLPYTLMCAYWSTKEPNHFPTDPTKLAEEFTALETHVKQAQKLIQSVKSDQGCRKGNTQNGSRNNKAKQPIPRKWK